MHPIIHPVMHPNLESATRPLVTPPPAGRDFFNALSAKDQEKFTEMLFKWLGGICLGVPVYVLRCAAWPGRGGGGMATFSGIPVRRALGGPLLPAPVGPVPSPAPR